MNKIQIIAQVEESDRNIYLTIINGSLCGVNYSQGLGDIDLHFMNLENHDFKLYNMVRQELDKDEKHSSDWFFPSPYWDEQVKIIDQVIWKYITNQNILDEIEELEMKIAKLRQSL
jgi:hypothetical protein